MATLLLLTGWGCLASPDTPEQNRHTIFAAADSHHTNNTDRVQPPETTLITESQAAHRLDKPRQTTAPALPAPVRRPAGSSGGQNTPLDISGTADKAIAEHDSSHQPPSSKDISHADFDTLLTKYVDRTGKVDYKGLKSEKARLEAYTAMLSSNHPGPSWSRNDQMAFWINTYNAHTLKLIIEHLPVNSIRDLDEGNPWDVQRIVIGENTLSLNQIEHEKLRPVFRDARIHFAVNCAAASCPPLSNRAFTAENLDAQLDKLTKDFINNPAFNQIKAQSAKVSKLFEWYSDDFGNVREYLNKYSDRQLAPGAEITFMEYDWALNSQ